MSLIERLQTNVEATSWRGAIPMNYVYTAGRAGELFFRAIQERQEFLASRCECCDTVYSPPKIFCPKCMKRIEDKMITVPNRGVVHTFTVCHEDFQEKEKSEPTVVAIIRLDGTDGGIAHRLGEIEPSQVRIGMPVEAVFKDQKERRGEILDILHFRPVE